MKRKWSFDENTGVASYSLFIDGREFTDTAACAEVDREFMSEKTGLTIASQRAKIKYLNHKCQNDLKPRIAALKQYYYSINMSKQFNDKSYEAKMLYRQIEGLEEELAATKTLLAQAKQDLDLYLTQKNSFYTALKRMRELRDKIENN